MEAPSVFFTEFCLSQPRISQYLTVVLTVFQCFSKLLRRCFPSVKIPLKMPWRACKMLPKRSQDAPRGSPNPLKTIQEAPKTLQRRPKRLPKRSQKLPHGFQGVPRGSQEASRGSTKPRRGSNRLSGGPFGSQEFLPKTKTLRNLTFDD